jgi:hypothetical protein
MIMFYFLKFEPPPTWRTWWLYLYPLGTGWSSYNTRQLVLVIWPLQGSDRKYRFQQFFNNSRSRTRSPSYFTTDGQSVCLGIEHPCETRDQILFHVGMLLSEICSLVSMGRPLWREGRSAICSVITQWSESLSTRNHTLLCHPRLPQPGGPGSRIYIQEKGGPVIPSHRLCYPIYIYIYTGWARLN